MTEVVYAPAVKEQLSNFNPDLSLTKKIESVLLDGPNGTVNGGLLSYNGYRFQEYKVGASLRFFANWLEGKFYVFLIGYHKDKKYDGITYDKKYKFPVSYDNSEISTQAMEKQTLKLITTIWGKNTMNSPYPIYD